MKKFRSSPSAYGCSVCSLGHYKKSRDALHYIDHLKIHHSLCEFGVNGGEAAVALFLYLIVEEVGGDAEMAWDNYIYACDALDHKHSK